MEIFRNPEIKRSLWLWLFLSGFCVAVTFFRVRKAAPLVFLFCLLFVGAWFFMTYRRYQKLRRLSMEIDRTLHEQTVFELNRFSEGELSILSSEVYKLTVRLREQANTLQKDKMYLADSLTDISHQLKTPLTSLYLIADFLSEEELTVEKRKELVREMLQLLTRIDWLIATLLKLSKLDAKTVRLENVPVNVKQLIEQAAKPLAIPLDLRNQRLVLLMSGEETFLGDSLWTREAVGNILKNCMEHTPEGGTLTVKAEETPLFTELVVEDTGNGIAPEDLPHLFERFYKGSGTGENGVAKNSIGIGLSLAQSIVTAQNGTIQVENKREGGARFTIRFYKSIV
jgi:signal transduction histidine kinase